MLNAIMDRLRLLYDAACVQCGCIIPILSIPRYQQRLWHSSCQVDCTLKTSRYATAKTSRHATAALSNLAGAQRQPNLQLLKHSKLPAGADSLAQRLLGVADARLKAATSTAAKTCINAAHVQPSAGAEALAQRLLGIADAALKAASRTRRQPAARVPLAGGLLQLLTLVQGGSPGGLPPASIAALLEGDYSFCCFSNRFEASYVYRTSMLHGSR